MTRGHHMLRRYQGEDADVSARDYGPSQAQLEMTPEEAKKAWDNFHDEETNEQIMSERKVF